MVLATYFITKLKQQHLTNKKTVILAGNFMCLHIRMVQE